MAKPAVFLLLAFACWDSSANGEDVQMTLNEWMALPDNERGRIASQWSPYESRKADSLPDLISEEFRKQYPNLNFRGLGNVHGSLELVVMRTFIFDKRLIPNSFLGVAVKVSLIEPVPDGFKVFPGYVWAPENYANFVDTESQKIRVALGDPSMSREEMLHALIGMPFDAWIEKCREYGGGYTNL
jgi:hypothetical protein